MYHHTNQKPHQHESSLSYLYIVPSRGRTDEKIKKMKVSFVCVSHQSSVLPLLTKLHSHQQHHLPIQTTDHQVTTHHYQQEFALDTPSFLPTHHYRRALDPSLPCMKPYIRCDRFQFIVTIARTVDCTIVWGSS